MKEAHPASILFTHLDEAYHLEDFISLEDEIKTGVVAPSEQVSGYRGVDAKVKN